MTNSEEESDRTQESRKVLKSLLGEIVVLAESDTQELRLKTAKGIFYFSHERECCEDVELIDTCGDLNDLVGTPILQAEIATNSKDDTPQGGADHRNLWTFYRFATIKGSVVLRWFGSSNGYYSVEVECTFTPSTGGQNDK